MRRAIEQSVKVLFGEVGAATIQADVLRVAAGGAIVRVQATQLRRLGAALTLNSDLRVLQQAPNLLLLL